MQPRRVFLLFLLRGHRAVCGEILLQPAASGRPVHPGRARRLQRERARGVHGAAHPHQPRPPQRGDGQDLLQPGDQGAVGQVPRAGDGDDHHQVWTVSGGKDASAGLAAFYFRGHSKNG